VDHGSSLARRRQDLATPSGRTLDDYLATSGPISRRTGPARGSATEMCGGGPGDREPGEFTDDTQMALLVAASLLER
ncbi:ADP-ribosylglycohydrolase family protein, partial [Enterococcus faecalis]|uniref:ADP-ribosylglycohydrolase family protein n=1 Tax=Enterococcus faecalis TaxID=1351 RepID=UPI003D6A38A3